MSISQWIETNFVLIAGVAASLKWVWEYSESRKFEKNKFLLERIERFNNLESTIQVQKLLDWNSINIVINSEVIKVDDDMIIESLVTQESKMRFDSKEVYIREIFDDYFTGLTELIILSKTGLVDSKNLKKFLKYWTQILNGEKRNKPKELISTIEKYLNFYGYVEIIEFIY